MMNSKSRSVTYFNAQAELGRDYQHPGGRPATEKLLSHIVSSGNVSRVLELGCGAGNTAALLLEQLSCLYAGIDSSPAMLRRARSSTERYRDRVLLLQAELRNGLLPFADASFEIVLAESVLAIIEPKSILRECHRVLRPGGMLAWNDRVWGDTLSSAEREEMNGVSRKVTGFHAAALDPTTAAEWRRLAEVNGFSLILVERVTRSPGPVRGTGSRLFQKARLVSRMIAHPKSLPVWFEEQFMARRYSEFWKKMEDWLFIARKL